MGLNEVAIGISPPGFAIELARSRVHPAWLSRTVTLGEMFSRMMRWSPDFWTGWFLQPKLNMRSMTSCRACASSTRPHTLWPSSGSVVRPSPRCAKQSLEELTPAAYRSSSAARTAVALPAARS